MAEVCSVSDCGRVIHAHGYCCAHYLRVLRHGDPHPEKPIRDYTLDPPRQKITRNGLVCAWCSGPLYGRQQKYCCWQHKKLDYRDRQKLLQYFGSPPNSEALSYWHLAYLRGWEQRLRTPEGIDICLDILRQIGLSPRRLLAQKQRERYASRNATILGGS